MEIRGSIVYYAGENPDKCHRLFNDDFLPVTHKSGNAVLDELLALLVPHWILASGYICIKARRELSHQSQILTMIKQ